MAGRRSFVADVGAPRALSSGRSVAWASAGTSTNFRRLLLHAFALRALNLSGSRRVHDIAERLLVAPPDPER